MALQLLLDVARRFYQVISRSKRAIARSRSPSSSSTWVASMISGGVIITQSPNFPWLVRRE